MGIEEFAARMVRLFEDRYRFVKPQETDAEVCYILELMVNTLRVPITELRQYSRPALVPKPTMKEAA
jgi:hypothetical protein